MSCAAPPRVAEPPAAIACADSARRDAQLLRIAYERLRLNLIMTALVVTLFGGLLWQYFPSLPMIAWAIALLVVSAARYLNYRAYARSRACPGADAASCGDARWHRDLVIGTALAGATWSFGAVALIDGAGHAESYLLPLTLLAVTAISTVSSNAHLKATWAFQVSALLPTALALAVTGGPVEWMACLIVLGGLFTLMAAGRAANAVVRSQIEAELRLAASLKYADAARERAEAASQAKSRFLANMSHELRTPLNAVIGAAQLMKADEPDPMQRLHLVEAIQRSGTNLLGLIENILDLSRIEAGEMKLREHDFHLLECIEVAMATAGLAARARGLQMACVVEPDLAAWRRGDEARLRQVLLNLMGNAVKFTARGEVVVRVQRAATGGGVRIEVADTGIGIDTALLPQVFEPFRQADEGSNRRYGGSGLGLTIVQQVVQAMGGQVSVRSEVGRGTCFSLDLPLEQAVQAPPAPAPLGLQVALVEPHEASAQALVALLGRMGCRVRPCGDAQALHAWITEFGGAPDAWLLIDTTAARADRSLASAAQRMDPRRTVSVSADEAFAPEGTPPPWRPARRLVKPVTRSALASAFATPFAVPGTLAAAAPRAAHGNASHGTHVLVVEDDALNQTIVCRLLQHAGYRATTASDGASALAALRAQRFDVVLMDWQMPDMDGVEVTHRARSGEAGEHAQQVPIVALTANAFAEDRETCLAAGMNDFLTKPVNAASLFAAIERWTRPRVAAPGDLVAEEAR